MNALARAEAWLRELGIAEPGPDVKLIAACAAGLPLKTALGAPPPDFTPDQDRKFRRLISRRGEGREPVQYLVGSEEFMGLEFKVGPAVLIPRPSTETLAERALAAPPGVFVEIGTGSGALAVVLARAGWTGTATDLSGRALAVARENARRHGVESRITFVECDLFPPRPEILPDLLISNPPYVSTEEMKALAPEVRHEPREALEAGLDGLDLIRRIVAAAPSWTRRLLLEFGASQGAAVSELALRAGFRDVRIMKDLDGFDRVMEATC